MNIIIMLQISHPDNRGSDNRGSTVLLLMWNMHCIMYMKSTTPSVKYLSHGLFVPFAFNNRACISYNDNMMVCREQIQLLDHGTTPPTFPECGQK